MNIAISLLLCLAVLTLGAIPSQAAAPWDVCLANEIDSGQGYCMTDSNTDGIPDTYSPLVGICQVELFPIEIRYLNDNQRYGYCATSIEPIETYSATEWYVFWFKMAGFTLFFIFATLALVAR